METLIDNSKCLASLAVFRELYDNEKDVYAVISEFLKETIRFNGKYQFSLTEITQLLNDNYEFNIPEAVVKTSLKRIKNIHKEKKGYQIDINEESVISNQIEKRNINIEKCNSLIINGLITYVEDKRKITLSKSEKSNLVNSLCSFMLDEAIKDSYSEYISAFIVKYQYDVIFSKQLNTIKEGVVLYTGLKYHSDLKETGKWDTDLVIFIETEILFHLAGYNGDLYKALFKDFFVFVNEINTVSLNKTGKRKIHLKYFQEVKDEIERFFKKAESIVNKKETLNPSKTAMVSIISGCQTGSDVIEKKVTFYQLLQTNGIVIDDKSDYYSVKNHQYNIEDKNILEHLSSSYNIIPNDISENLRFLNYINICRKGVSDLPFENIKTILLSGNSTTIQIAWDKEIKKNGNVPLATTLSFLTNKFWFRLGKGFGEDCYPKTFDIITKAQIILSTQVNESISDKFDALQIDLKEGKLNKEDAIQRIVELRRQAKKPEEVVAEDLTEILDCISEDEIDRYNEQQAFINNENQKRKEENDFLKKELQEKNDTVSKLKNEFENTKIYNKFKKAQGKYKKERIKYINKRVRETIKKRFYYALLYCLLPISAILLLLYKESATEKSYYIALITLVSFIVPFINHNFILKNLRDILHINNRKKRRQMIYDFIQEYSNIHKPPTLEQQKVDYLRTIR